MSALTSIGPLVVPHPPPGLSSSAFAVRLLDTNGEKLAFIIQVPKAGTLHSFEFPTTTVTTFPTDGIKLSFQDLKNTGITLVAPDGTVDQFVNITSNPGSNVWVVPGGPLTVDGTGGGAKRSVSKGDFLACVIEQVTSTDAWSFNVGLLEVETGARGFPGAVVFSGVWGGVSAVPCMALKYDDNSYGQVSWLFPMKTITNDSFGSSSDPKERGLYFQFPVEVKVRGCWFIGSLPGNADIILYDSNGTTELASLAFDADYRVISGAQRHYVVEFPSEVTLAAATNYRLVLQPTTTTTINLVNFAVEAADRLDAVEGGQAFHYTQKSSADAWSQTTTKRPFMGLIVSAVHDGTGGGGGSIFNIME